MTTPTSQRSSVMQNWPQVHCPRYIDKNERPPYSSDLNPLDYHVWGTMLEKYHKLQSKPKMTDELKVALQTIWEELAQEHINKAVTNFIKCLVIFATALLMCSYGSSSQMVCRATFNSSIVLCFGWSSWYLSSMAPQT